MLSVKNDILIRYVASFGSNVGSKPDLSFEFDKTLDFINNNLLTQTRPTSRRTALQTFKNKYSDVYNLGDNKWQNPKYHQYTITDHMLKAMAEAIKVIQGENEYLDKLLTPAQKQLLLAEFDKTIDGVKKGTLFVLAMAFHDLDKIYAGKQKTDQEGNICKINPACHSFFISDKIVAMDACYWTYDCDPTEALKKFDELAIRMNLQPASIKYVKNIIQFHDNPLRHIVWPVCEGEKNITKLFETMKQNTPFSLKELALIYLADQSAKGNATWIEHLETISPWKGLFKSLVAERPLKELEKVLEQK